MKRNFGTIGVMGAMLLGSAAFAADGLKVGGYVDAGYSWAKAKSSVGSVEVTAPTTNTLHFNEAAISVSKDLGAGGAHILLPFNYDTVSGSQAVTFNGSNAEAFVSWKYDNGFSWKLGQFASIYGFEGKDSVDHRFTSTGLLFNVLPSTHAGWLGSYTVSDSLVAHILVANPAGQSTTAAGAGNPDLGFRLDSKMDSFHASVGGLFSHAVGSGKTDWTFDVIGGTKAGVLNIDAEVVFQNDSRYGFLGQVGYAVSDATNVAAKLEYQVPVKDEKAKNMLLAVGPEFVMSSDLSVKADFNWKSSTKTPASVEEKASGYGVSASAVYKF